MQSGRGFRVSVLIIGSCLLLSACGGGGGGGATGSNNNAVAAPAPAANQAPVINRFAATQMTEQQRIEVTWSVTDADNDAIGCQLALQQNGSTVATHTVTNCSATQTFLFQVDTAGDYRVDIMANDGAASVNSNTFVTVTTSTPTQPEPPSQAITSMKIYYMHSTQRYEGWGLHLWGDAMAPELHTTWQNPMAPTRVNSDYAYWEVPIINPDTIFSFIVHYGDLKSPNYDLILTPSEFGDTVWVVEDRVAREGAGITAVPFADEAIAMQAFNDVVASKGVASDALDMSEVTVSPPLQTLRSDWQRNPNFMEVYVRAYQDSDGDGVGDFNGLTSRLPYLAELGITALWLMPIMESADNDHGYETQDYRDVESDYGTMADFQRLLDTADGLGIAIIIDYVINHAASQNPVFLDAASRDDHPLRDWFIWRDNVDNNWQLWGRTPWRTSPYGVYYGAFTERMPDFNLRNPEVIAFHQNNLRYWLNMGVDGFRFDAVGVLVENGAGRLENQPENLDVMAAMNQVIADYPNAYMVCEAPGQFRDFADPQVCRQAFNFTAHTALMQSVQNEVLTRAFINEINADNHDLMPLILANHDLFAGNRVYNQLSGNLDKYKVAAATYLLLSPTPFTYYGEEIGLAAAPGFSDDRAIRTPMSWTNDATHAGFSTRTPFRVLSANSQQFNVEMQQGQPDSLYAWYQSLYALRQAYPELSTGTLDVLSQANDRVLRFTRTQDETVIHVFVNVSGQSQSVSFATQATSILGDAVVTNGQLVLDAYGVSVWRE